MTRRGFSGRLVAVDIVDRSLRAVEVNLTPEAVEVTGLGSAALSAPLSEGTVAEAQQVLRQVLREAHLSARQAIALVPRHLAILKPMSLPEMSPAEIVAAVRLQAERELPFPAAEARLDYAPTGLKVAVEAGPGEPSTLAVGFTLVAVQRTVVETLRVVLSGAGLTPRQVAFRPAATAAALVFSGVDPRDEFVAVVDLGETMTEIDIVRNRHLVFSRSVSIGGMPGPEHAATGPDREGEAGPTAAEEAPADDAGIAELDLSVFDRWQTSLVGTVRQSLAAFAMQPGGAPVARVVLTGIGADDERLAGALADAVGAPVETAQAFERVTLSRRAAEVPARERLGFTTALGAALGHGRELVPAFDFLVPLEARLRRKAPVRRYVALGAGAVLLAALIGVPLYLYGSLRQQLGRLTAQIDQRKQREAEVEKLRARIAEIDPWTLGRQRDSRYDAFLRLSELWPSQRRAYLTEFRFEAANDVVVSGRAQNVQAVNELLDALKASGVFGVPDFSGVRVSPGDTLGYPLSLQLKAKWLGGPAAETQPARRPTP